MKNKIELILEKNVEQVIEKDHLSKLLESGNKLVVKYGADPSAPDLHLGHWVGLKKLKDFQELGHKIVFIIGDFTAMIGDPSGKNKARPALSADEVKKNAKTYFDQVGKVLDLKKTEVVFNSKWLSKLTLADILKITSHFTAARILERDDFEKRYKAGVPIGLHELLYPVMQAYDSLEIKSDVEIGGTDQRFNMLAGRELQKEMGQKPQDMISLPLLIGLDGKNKMSKSLGNYIGITEPADSMFGKLMSIPDSLIMNYFVLLTEKSSDELKKINHALSRGEINPKDLKVELAKEIITELHSKADANKAEKEFEKVFSRREMPSEIPEVSIKIKQLTLIDLVIASKLTLSKSDARRVIEQGGVKINDIPHTDPFEKVSVKSGNVLRVGKLKFVRIK